MSPAEFSELQAAFLQAVITGGLCALCAFLYAQYRKPYLLWWSFAWGLYVLRVGAIIGFLSSANFNWLFVHQVLTGWTALALLWAAVLFSRQPRFRWRYLPIVLFPLAWSYVAIHELDSFAAAAWPAVLFLSLATLWTGWVFLRYRRRIGSQGATLLATAFFLWGLHHLDYPILRARGAWNPWGYYLDILFLLVIGAGTLLLVVDELHRGLGTLSVLSADLQRGDRPGDRDSVRELLARPLALGGVRGSALYIGAESGWRFAGGLGACEEWESTAPSGALAELIAAAVREGKPTVSRDWNPDPAARDVYAAVLPIFHGDVVAGALVIIGDERDPFAALGDSFLVALGQQVGAALERGDLYARLAARTHDLEHLSLRVVRQHEEERRKIALELHDETAQLFSAVKMQLGLVRESVDPAATARVDRAVQLVDDGIRSIRRVTSDLRPPLLDDLGLVPALRALATDFSERSGLQVDFETPRALPPLSPEAELALFRALQEALSNVARHASAASVEIRLRDVDGAAIELDVSDDGTATRGSSLGGLTEGAGLTGMRERIGALGGSVDLVPRASHGLGVRIRVPLSQAVAP